MDIENVEQVYARNVGVFQCSIRLTHPRRENIRFRFCKRKNINQYEKRMVMKIVGGGGNGASKPLCKD